MKYSPFALDLHTHSIISHDGGLLEQDYLRILKSGLLDYIAITDHNTIEFAQYLNKKIGNQIIVGEEIKTKNGEIIGLFLSKPIASGLSADETVNEIHTQHGLVYIPHPFEKVRYSLSYETLMKLKNKIDILETFNARSFGRKSSHNREKVAKENNFVQAASSDAHCQLGIGTAYSVISEKPTNKNLSKILKTANYKKTYAPLFAYLCPLINRMRHLKI